MKIKITKAWEQFTSEVIELSNNARLIGLGGIGVCWLFKKDLFVFPKSIYYAIGFFVTYFILDILTNFIGFIGRQIWLINEEKYKEIEVDEPPLIGYMQFSTVILKIIALIIGFLFIGKEIVYEL